MSVLTVRNSLLADYPPVTLAEALFLSPLQPSAAPTSEEVAVAIDKVLSGCTSPGELAALFAGAYGDCMDEVGLSPCPRMQWALAAVAMLR